MTWSSLASVSPAFSSNGRIGKAAQVLRQVVPELPRLLFAEDLVHVVHDLVELLVGFALHHLVGPDVVSDFVEHVAAVERVEYAQEEVEIHLQPGFGIGLREAARLLEQQHAEAVEPGIA